MGSPQPQGLLRLMDRAGRPGRQVGCEGAQGEGFWSHMPPSWPFAEGQGGYNLGSRLPQAPSHIIVPDIPNPSTISSHSPDFSHRPPSSPLLASPAHRPHNSPTPILRPFP